MQRRWPFWCLASVNWAAACWFGWQWLGPGPSAPRIPSSPTTWPGIENWSPVLLATLLGVGLTAGLVAPRIWMPHITWATAALLGVVVLLLIVAVGRLAGRTIGFVFAINLVIFAVGAAQRFRAPSLRATMLAVVLTSTVYTAGMLGIMFQWFN
jgi:hypothetical protein